MTNPNPRPVPLEQTRERIVTQLCDQYAAENLTDTALEERLTKAYAATTVVALQELVADLPTEAPGSSTGVAVARPDMVSERQVILAVMGGAERKGAWTPPQHLHVVTVMGGAHLDFREARFSPGVTDVTCFVLMGGVEIIVPPGVHVELNGFALMGGFGQHGGRELPSDPNAPVLRIGGVAVMGGVDLQVRLPGQSEGDVRAAERLARREAKRLGRGGGYDI
ncbi:Cell wall-active antibiotics response 4TMS YvqF [bacterium JGI 053]|nr:Cell wall-active antibiotics response 4TMS YvqF [bacterium JGI 053]